jgi:hypothetical protein
MNGYGSYKDKMIADAENAINQFRKKRALLEEELLEIEIAEEDARSVLQLLKTGKVENQPNGKRKVVSQKKFREAVQGLGEGGARFTPKQVAEALGMNNDAAALRLRENLGTLVVKVEDGGPGKSPKYILKP